MIQSTVEDGWAPYWHCLAGNCSQRINGYAKERRPWNMLRVENSTLPGNYSLETHEHHLSLMKKNYQVIEMEYLPIEFRSMFNSIGREVNNDPML